MSWGMYYTGEASAVLSKVMQTTAYPEYAAQTMSLNEAKSLIATTVQRVQQILADASIAAGGNPQPLYIDLKASGHLDASGQFNLSIELKRIHLELEKQSS